MFCVIVFWANVIKKFDCDLRIFIPRQSVCQARLEELKYDAHSSLLRKSVFYGQKSFITLGPDWKNFLAGGNLQSTNQFQGLRQVTAILNFSDLSSECATLLRTSCERPGQVYAYISIGLGCSQLVHRRVIHD